MNNTRIPRPMGITELSRLYDRTKEEQYYQDLRERIIHHYTRNNFSYCGHYLNIEQFSRHIGISEIEVQRYMGNYGKELGKLSKELIDGDIVRALTNLSFNWGLEDRARTQQQLALMLQSQGATYKPFISAEVGKTLKLSMDANNNMMALMKSFMTGTTTYTPIPEGNNPDDKGITADQAIRLFKEHKVLPLNEDEAQRNALAQQYQIELMPEVNALLQTNVDTSKEGLNMLDITRIREGQIKEDKHLDRRAEELNIDLDEDEI